MKKELSIWDEMRKMQEQMDAMLDNIFLGNQFTRRHNLLEGPKNLVTSNYKQPISDIYETEKEVIAEIEMPGLDKKDIKVHVSEKGIEIKAENKVEIKKENKKEGMYRFERSYSGYSRYFSLPSNVDSKKANAEYKDGVLKITVPKLKIEESKKKLLEIK